MEMLANQLPVDILMLPEMAFVGYNVDNRTEMEPFAEDVSGETITWAKDVVSKGYAHLVLIGFPESCNGQLFNSACIVCQDSYHIYRKHFLYSVDETWATAGQGFSSFEWNGLQVVPGICMDLNPCRFEAPFTAFEFAHHCIQVQARLLLILNAWRVGTEDELVNEPSLQTISYWAKRLSPLTASTTHSPPIIVAICNRTGLERGVPFAGSSSVLLLRDGRAFLLDSLTTIEESSLIVNIPPETFKDIQPSTSSISESHVRLN